jgi:hypothetical protein
VSAGLPEAVCRLIAEHIDSVEQLEVLLLLWRHASRGWAPEAVARELRIEPASADKRLEDLERGGFLQCRDRACREYWYAPAPSERDALVRGLAEGYAERRVTVINLIFSKPVDRIRTFADAFLLRKDEDSHG